MYMHVQLNSFRQGCLPKEDVQGLILLPPECFDRSSAGITGMDCQASSCIAGDGSQGLLDAKHAASPEQFLRGRSPILR